MIIRFILSIDLSVCFARLLHATIISKNLGPKIIMIKKMLADMGFFMIIFSVFIVSFGVTTQVFKKIHLNLNQKYLTFEFKIFLYY